MKWSVCTAAFASAAVYLSSAALAGAQPAPVASATPKPAANAAPGDTADYDKFVKGADKQTGLFTLWRKDGKVYLELRGDQLDTDYLEHTVPVNGLGGFGFHSGDQLVQAARIIRFHDTGKALAVVLPQTRFIAPAGSPIATAIRESTADSVEALLPVVAENKGEGLKVVDLSAFLGDQLDLGNELNDAVGADHNPQGAYRLDPSRTYFGPSKAFPKNVIVEADQTFASAKPDAIDTVPDPRSVQMKVKYNFSEILASPDYMPRLYDDRVGYWSNPHASFDNDSKFENDRFYILRWNMQASDPAKASSPAKRTMVFYLDRSIPMEYRAPIRDGVLEWNKAFAKIGITNAVSVVDAPEDGSWDPDDIRYNVIRWVTDDPTEFGAEAQVVWDPRTGEIFRGGVLLDANLGRYAKFSEKNLLNALMLPATETVPAGKALFHGPNETDYGAGLLAQNAWGATALELTGDSSHLSDYVYQRLKDVAMHEVGHDFGLSHNFIGHMAYSTAEIKSDSFTKAHGVSSSVMDYSPVNVWPKGQSKGQYSSTTLGTYDYHVIHWGYAPVPGAKSPQDEKTTLDRWASSSFDPKYAFAGDEDGFYAGGHAIDPRAAPFLLTNKPLDWCASQLNFVNHLFSTIDYRFPEHQEPWSDERQAFTSLLGKYDTCAQTATHYIAGEYVSRNRIGDPGTHVALTPVPRSEEWKAYSLLDKYVFADSAWKFSPTTLRRLVYQEKIPFPDGYGYDPTPRHDLAVVELVNAMQYRDLGSMYAPLVLQRLADMPTKAAPGTTMTLSDLFTWSQASIFGEIGSKSPHETQIRRNLQRVYARLLSRLITSPAAGTPYDAQALARLELADLDGRVAKSLASGSLDLQTRAHLTAMRTDIERALDAKTVLPAG